MDLVLHIRRCVEIKCPCHERQVKYDGKWEFDHKFIVQSMQRLSNTTIYINEIFDYCILKCNSIVLLTRLVLEYDPFYYTQLQLDKKFKQNLLLILYFVLLYSLPCSLWVIGHRVELLCLMTVMTTDSKNGSRDL